MTDAHDPELDELASAHLDGLTTPGEAAQVESDPALLAKVEALRAVREAIQEAPTVDPAAREAAVAAALVAYADEPRPATVTPLSPRRGLSPRATQVLRVAAVVLVIALLVPVVASLVGGDDAEMSFNSTGDAISGATDGGSELAEDSAGGEGQDVSTTAPTEPEVAASDGLPGVTDLGSFDDVAALVAALGAPNALERAADAPAPDAEYSPAVSCASAGEVVRAVAQVAGERVAILLRDAADPRTVSIVTVDDCAVLATRRL